MVSRVVFEDGTTLRFAGSVVEEISNLIASKGFDSESGGILLGKQVLGTQHFEVTLASKPSAFDVSRRFSFLRRMSPANKLINSAWRKSKGTVNYLGEWHTHNESKPVPSKTDKSLMLQVVEDSSCPFTRAFMLIIGNAGEVYVGVTNPQNREGIYNERLIKWQ
ncbi:hypothetical protein Ccur_13890 [Cryptobacterium curtum DSM 15641]|uniref:JAB domain-containing protein n=1 Tax=Cryptobacterium curtum (strain ATCC 700683 / DSM 15641 / CCUG 43107 / 12-3) TaxID=469378 RepID=C7MLB7_CRYCD|nr:Mov34/MPN/PAD-1 family protein [Cryptobacterium curtum]ACU95064.1 hypothetical protein Ccur_13890 [Cryptobacterium curtum DSM 15641]